MTPLRSADSPPTSSPHGLEPADRPLDKASRADHASSEAARWSLQRWAVTSGSIGFFLTVMAVTAVVGRNGGGLGSIGAGIMVAGFDGFPFGAMLGVMVYYLKYPEVT